MSEFIDDMGFYWSKLYDSPFKILFILNLNYHNCVILKDVFRKKKII